MSVFDDLKTLAGKDFEYKVKVFKAKSNPHVYYFLKNLTSGVELEGCINRTTNRQEGYEELVKILRKIRGITMNRFEPIQGKADVFPDNSNQALWNKLEYLQADNAKLQADLKDLREKLNELNSATLEIVARDIGKVKQSVKEAKAEVKTEVQQLSQELKQNFEDFKVMSGQKVLKVRDELKKDLNFDTGALYRKIAKVEAKIQEDATAIYRTIGIRVEDLIIHFESKLNEIRPTIDLVYLIKVALKKLLRIK